jgi:hypothetical protein
VSKIDTSSAKSFSSYHKKGSINSNSFFINPTTPEEVLDELGNLDQNKAEDIYNVNIKLIKMLSSHLCYPLEDIINTSFSIGTFPNKLKFARVTPLFKAGEKTNPGNYRPVSVLPIFDKIIEKLMKKRLVKFLEDNNVLSDVQFGFRKNKSTTMAVLSILQNIYLALERKQIPCCLFLDFAKAFDTVDHKILFSKLSHYGIRGLANDWFKSYLSNRYQSVCIGSVLSDKEVIEYGVPQGSVLGPILFLLYINDIANSTKAGNLTLFADDSALFYACNNKNQLEKIINEDLKNISQWLISNRLTLNVLKSNFVVFGQKNKLALSISLNNVPLEQKDCVKYLGIYLDHKLSWNHHIDIVKKKLSSAISIIYKLRYFVSPDILKHIYYAFIYSNILYGLEVWGAANKTNLVSVSKLMNKSIRALSFKGRDDDVKPAL